MVAQQIYDTFIEDGAELEINIDHRIKSPILKEIDRGNQNCFAEAKKAMFALMEPIFLRFRSLDTWEKMKREIGLNNAVYGRAEKNAAVQVLLSNLDSPTTEVTNPVRVRHFEIIRAILHEFCKRRLKIDFADNSKA